MGLSAVKQKDESQRITPPGFANQRQEIDVKGSTRLNMLVGLALRGLALQFRIRPSLRKHLKGVDGWINFSLGLCTEAGNVEQYITFADGRISVSTKRPAHVDVTITAIDDQILKEIGSKPPNEVLVRALHNKINFDGNLAYMQLFNYLVSLVTGGLQQRMVDKAHKADVCQRKAAYQINDPGLAQEVRQRRHYRMKGGVNEDPGVKHLDDSYLSQFVLEDFPRLKRFIDRYLSVRPEVDPERITLLTDWYREHGWEKDNAGQDWFPPLRNSLAFRHMMEKKQPIINDQDLIAGTTGSKEITTHVFGDGQGTMLWAELNSMEKRVLNAYTCSRDTAATLHHDIFPFWADKTFREYVRREFDNPHCQKIDDRWVAYYVWKSTGVSHTIPNFKTLLEKGINGIKKDVLQRSNDAGIRDEQRQTLTAMTEVLDGTLAYAVNLSAEASRQAQDCIDVERKAELEELGRICAKVPAQPADTLAEALNAIYIIWVALNNENSDTGLSLGRLDQWLQPYFKRDMSRLSTNSEKEAYIKKAVELVGCFAMRLTDHVPITPDIANYLFGGATSTQAITLGGVTPQGDDAVNDMTYIFLKVAEMLRLRDTNYNCRYHPEVNSDNYLKRMCEVNIIAQATPIMNSDPAMFKALAQHGYPMEDIRDWAATGCVEPTLQGKHFSHTGSILLNMVASLEMALNNGYHPLMRWQAGPQTGSIEAGDFKTFEAFFEAWASQQRFIIDQACTLNNMLGQAHQQIRPTPLLSVLIDGNIENAADALHGGSKYNSSGTSNIGLADVIDSMLVIKVLVFDEKKFSFKALKNAIDNDFEGHAKLHAMVMNKVPKFGSGNAEAREMAARVTEVVHDAYMSTEHYRGGRYAAGFWSMSQHVAYGGLSGTLPSGRLRGKAFTPGLTPHPNASNSLTDNLMDVAALDPKNLDNNLAFNVKLTPGADDTREKAVGTMAAYVKSYMQQGGMQVQFNVVSSETLKDAVANPENYRDLLVRISGYNAYYVDLNRDIQTELIERAEYQL